MLSKAHRINKRKDFDNIFRQGGVAQDGFLLVRFLPNRGKNSRFGLIVSAKVAKKAVDRNHLRRQLSEIIRLNLKRIGSGWDFVLVGKVKLIGAGYGEIESSLAGLLKKKNLYAR